MKKKIRVSAIAVSVLAIGALALAPFLIHNPKSVGTAIAYTEKPQNQSVTAPAAVAVVQTLKQEPVIPVEKVSLKRTIPSTKVMIPAKTNNKPPAVKSKQPITTQNDSNITQTDRKVEKTEPGPTVTKKKLSPWGISLLTAKSGVDAGVSYRLLEIPILKGIDLDLAAGLKHAGLGLSKNVYKNLGVGLIGTIAYNNGEKSLGIYAKYSF